MPLSPLWRAFGSGSLAAGIALLMWYGLTQMTGAQLNFVAAGVGWAIGLAVEKAVGPNGSWQAKTISGALAVVTIFLGSYLALNHLHLRSVLTTTEWLTLTEFFEIYQTRMQVRVGSRISLGVIELVSALIGVYEAIITPPGEPKTAEPQN
jgi:hypothetical protein